MPKIKPTMSDHAVKAKTGKVWSEWFKILDAAGAKKMTHQEIAALLHSKHHVGPWWTQMVTVTYEQARGLRDKHQKPGGYEISVSRTVDASLSKAFKAWTDEIGLFHIFRVTRPASAPSPLMAAVQAQVIARCR